VHQRKDDRRFHSGGRADQDCENPTLPLRLVGIRDRPTAPASPWQNGFAERLIGSIRRECLDHIIVLGEAHLRRILKSYADYYNGVRTHRSLNKDAPDSRLVQRAGVIRSRSILGGLHHHYGRIWGFRYTQLPGSRQIKIVLDAFWVQP
jgi:Integrase core domain